ncbi:hypothetical protein [Guyparkeria sp. SCN-R1]|uniref:hypothetical protein n=1 Tax=Guyparkeria sp. SCN-R1 TaxID=2341113 RepID=UPI000F655E37|nr:hypothetical protein [Guyparkeria sp. SCN-R1]
MKKNLVVHVGLPKTGTTYLQKKCFPKLVRATYFGKHYEANESDKARHAFMRFLEGGGKQYERLKSEFLGELDKAPSDVVLISDEMILVDTPKCTWQKKLARISDLRKDPRLGGIEVVVIFRNPVDAAYSFYVECQALLSSTFPSYSMFVLQSNQAQIFNFDKLTTELSVNFKPDEFGVFSYDRLCKRQNGLASVTTDILGENIADQNIVASIENKKKVRGDSYYSNSVSLLEKLSSQRWTKSVLRRIPRIYYGWLASIFSQIKVGDPVLVTRDEKQDQEISRALNVESERDSLPKTPGDVKYVVVQ